MRAEHSCCGRAHRGGLCTSVPPPNGVESEFAARTAVGHNMPRAAHVWLACGAQLLRQDLLPRTRCTPHCIGCVCNTSAVAGRTAQEAVSEFAARTAVGYDMPRAAHVWLSCGAQLLRQDLFPRTRCTPHYIGCVCDTSAVAGHTAQEAVSEFAVPRAAGVLHVSRLLRDITYGNAQFVRIC